MIKILLLTLFCWSQSGIYDFQPNDSTGGVIDFSAFRHKKILLVNIATQNRYNSQLKKLEQLYQLYKDSLVIVVFPSNSFGHEPGTNASITAYCHDSCGISFPIAGINPVSGAYKQTVYQWLTTIGQNGRVDGDVIGDYQKFLVNEDGQLIGVFAPSIDPLATEIINAIQGQ